MSVQAQFDFRGSTYDPGKDKKRLGDQLKRVKDLMLDNHWRTLRQISDIVHAPEASVSARLRDLRKLGFKIERRRESNGNGLHSYRLLIP